MSSGLRGSAVALVATLVATTVGAETEVTKLGGRNAFNRIPIQTAGDATMILGELRSDIDTVLEKAGWMGRPADLHAAIAKGDWREIQVPMDGRLTWMALRRKGEADLLTDVVWKGKEAFPAYELQVVSNEHLYTFVVPKACANLALTNDELLPPPVAKISAAPQTDCLTRQINVDASSSMASHGRKISKVDVEVKKPDGSTEQMPRSGDFRWQKSWRAPGTYTFTAVAETDTGRRSAPASVSVERTPCPPTCAMTINFTDRYTKEPFTIDASGSSRKVGTLTKVTIELTNTTGDEGNATLELEPPFRGDTMLEKPGMYKITATVHDDLGQHSENACAGMIRIDSRMSVLLDTLVGNERRWREEFPYDRSAAQIGVKAGPAYRVTRNFEVVGAGGVAINLRDTDNTSLFADFEGNWMGEKGMLGVGVGFWDFAHSETRTGSFLAHGGFNLPWEINYKPVIFLLEGRFFFDHAEHLDNNFLLWGGLRFHF